MRYSILAKILNSHMNLSHNKNLYVELFTKIARMHDEVDYRMHLNEYRGQGGQWKDYPSVSVGAELENVTAIGHHHYVSTANDFHPLIRQELTIRLGGLNEIGRKNPDCKNRVGHCAENYAATSVFELTDPTGNINNAEILSRLHFTKAFRPRTWRNIEWCDNCHTMFD